LEKNHGLKTLQRSAAEKKGSQKNLSWIEGDLESRCWRSWRWGKIQRWDNCMGMNAVEYPGTLANKPW